MKKYKSYLLATALVIMTYTIFSLFVLQFHNLSTFVNLWYWLLPILEVITIIIVLIAILRRRYSSVFSIYSFLLGLSFIFFIKNLTLLYFIGLPIVLGLVVLILHIRTTRNK